MLYIWGVVFYREHFLTVNGVTKLNHNFLN